ncbi:leucyl aminopeptidase [Paracoccus sediminicola]|uniref:leucyl aminopeptidase n=1 Tax=Paracoccus sediminicola TaxID=3017783 RepID=UPI0022EFFCE4|nr:leucyl aminopeptidase [Paracoccus sediminicola]WBU57329.1 leucyl aminopeptidase [Paracoccus sediminicola]
MTHPVEIRFTETTTEGLESRAGRVALIVGEDGKLPPKIPRKSRNAISRAADSRDFQKLKPGEAMTLSWPTDWEAESVMLVKLPRKVSVSEARKAGGAIGAALGDTEMLVMAHNHPQAAEIALGIALRGYDFSVYKTRKNDADGDGEDGAAGAAAGTPPQSVQARGGAQPDALLNDAAGGETARVADDQEAEQLDPKKASVTFMCANPEDLSQQVGDQAAVAEGVFFTRDLVNEPANILTTIDFADRLAAMEEIGLTVEVLDEAELEKLGMRALLAVGQGSESPSKVVVMRWDGGAKGEAPVALVGKGVVFDTGGISIKPAAGMEEMTMDMGGAGVVAGVMRTLALRRAKANVVGLVGLVENMPDGRAQRPGDIVRSMKGDTIEVINTDAEGRLVLADVLWYAQDRFEPAAIIDLATLTGAVIIALGHEHAGIFSNDDELSKSLLKASDAEGEGAWRLPLAPAYDKQLESRLADMKNVGGRPAGSITAAQFLQRFIRDGQPWAHIDIAGVALPPGGSDLAPKGASGWGVMTLNRLIRDQYEG